VSIAVFCINPLILQTIQIITVWDFVRFELPATILRRSPLFTGLRRSDVKKIILLGRVLEIPDTDVLVHQGETGEEMYLLLTGKAEVFLENNNRKQVLKTIEPGELVGEMALLGENMRSASVRAAAAAKWLRIDEKSLKRVQKNYPRIAATLFYNIAVILSDRLKDQIGAGPVQSGSASTPEVRSKARN
jgi:CRP-like cAMP-binding protein